MDTEYHLVSQWLVAGGLPRYPGREPRRRGQGGPRPLPWPTSLHLAMELPRGGGALASWCNHRGVGRSRWPRRLDPGAGRARRARDLRLAGPCREGVAETTLAHPQASLYMEPSMGDGEGRGWSSAGDGPPPRGAGQRRLVTPPQEPTQDHAPRRGRRRRDCACTPKPTRLAISERCLE